VNEATESILSAIHIRKRRQCRSELSVCCAVHALCVLSALSALKSQGNIAAMQLVFLISNGRIERDSCDTLQRLVREMVERNVFFGDDYCLGNED
jgi:hypothetical protein